MSTQTANHGLMNALNFDEHDLQANREGRVTDKQRKRLWRRWFFAVGLQFVLLAVLVFCISWAIIGNRNIAAPAVTTSFIVFMVAMIFLWFGSFIYTWFTTQRYLREVKVLFLQGPVYLFGGNRSHAGVTILVGQQRESVELKVPFEIARLIEHNAHYRFYLLPPNNTLLSAEKLSSPEKLSDSLQPDLSVQAAPYGTTLMQAFQIDVTDIQVNREGRFTKRQHRTIFKHFRIHFGYSLFLMPCFLIFAIGGIAFIGVGFRGARDMNIPIIISAIIIGLIILPAGWLTFRIIGAVHRLRLDLHDNHVNLFDGQIEVQYGEDSRATIRAGKLWFTLPKTTANAFANFGYYRLYYTPRSKLLVAAEYPPDKQAVDPATKPADRT